MNNNNNSSFLKFLLIFVLGFVSLYLIQNFTLFDRISFLNQKTSKIVVYGSAQENIPNQLAEFTAGIEVIAPEKNEAINSANEIMNQLLSEIDSFGINKEDVQTSQVSVYQEYEDVIEPHPESELMPADPIKTVQKGNWRANISISISMRNEDSNLLKSQSEELLNILNNSQANYVYGPNFMIDEQKLNEIELINSAVADARNKAEAIAAANRQKIKKVLEIIEDGANNQAFPRGEFAFDQASSDAFSLEPGSSTLYKTVVVTFQVK
ncbi:MAG: SIMPL domain-containing protein [Candidatus Pacebacteria bacterium]|jgi:hypothetical protein|nr:SIMPL domain-containing protein [Candidatus Paceibacterota bacterium]